jgi:hypothetical protein
LTASVLAGHISSSTGQPALSRYTLVLWSAGLICAAAALLVWILSTREQAVAPDQKLDDIQIRLVEQTEGADPLTGGSQT